MSAHIGARLDSKCDLFDQSGPGNVGDNEGRGIGTEEQTDVTRLFMFERHDFV